MNPEFLLISARFLAINHEWRFLIIVDTGFFILIKNAGFLPEWLLLDQQRDVIVVFWP
jgi:hypothetical protein